MNNYFHLRNTSHLWLVIIFWKEASSLYYDLGYHSKVFCEQCLNIVFFWQVVNFYVDHVSVVLWSGTSDGQTKIVREGDNGVAYAWNVREQKWDKVILIFILISSLAICYLVILSFFLRSTIWVPGWNLMIASLFVNLYIWFILKKTSGRWWISYHYDWIAFIGCLTGYVKHVCCMPCFWNLWTCLILVFSIFLLKCNSSKEKWSSFE